MRGVIQIELPKELPAAELIMHILCVHLMPLEKLYSFSCSSHFARTLYLGIRLHHRLVSSSEGHVEEVEI